ncbi:MAG: hypothetical protein STSR0009_29220 [Methanoregula sp.]
MGAILTRGFVAINDAYYVCTLSEVSHSPEAILTAKQSFSESNGSFTRVFREYENGEIKCIAEGFEKTISRSIQVEGKSISWSERLVYAKLLTHEKKNLPNLI